MLWGSQVSPCLLCEVEEGPDGLSESSVTEVTGREMDFSGSWRKWPGGRGDGESREVFEKLCCEEKVVGRDVRSRKCFFFFSLRREKSAHI